MDTNTTKKQNTMSTNQIRAFSPCATGYKKLLQHLKKTEGDDEQIPFTVILESNGIHDAIWCMRVNWFEHKQQYMEFVDACAERAKKYADADDAAYDADADDAAYDAAAAYAATAAAYAAVAAAAYAVAAAAYAVAAAAYAAADADAAAADADAAAADADAAAERQRQKEHLLSLFN